MTRASVLQLLGVAVAFGSLLLFTTNMLEVEDRVVQLEDSIAQLHGDPAEPIAPDTVRLPPDTVRMPMQPGVEALIEQLFTALDRNEYEAASLLFASTGNTVQQREGLDRSAVGAVLSDVLGMMHHGRVLPKSDRNWRRIARLDGDMADAKVLVEILSPYARENMADHQVELRVQQGMFTLLRWSPRN